MKHLVWRCAATALPPHPDTTVRNRPVTTRPRFAAPRGDTPVAHLPGVQPPQRRPLTTAPHALQHRHPVTDPQRGSGAVIAQLHQPRARRFLPNGSDMPPFMVPPACARTTRWEYHSRSDFRRPWSKNASIDSSLAHVTTLGRITSVPTPRSPTYPNTRRSRPDPRLTTPHPSLELTHHCPTPSRGRTVPLSPTSLQPPRRTPCQ